MEANSKKSEDVLNSENSESTVALSESSIRAMLEVMPSMGYAYEDIPAFLENVVQFLKVHFECGKAALILSRAYGGTMAGNLGRSDQITGDGSSETGIPLPFRDLLANHSPASGSTPELREICLEINRQSSIDNSVSAPTSDASGSVLESYGRALNQMGFQFVYPVLLQRDLVGLILLGEAQKPFDNQDALFVEMGSALLALTLRNAAIRRENSRLRLNQMPPAMEMNSRSLASESSKPSQTESESKNNAQPGSRRIQVGNRSIVVSDALWNYSLDTWSRLATVDVPILISGETGTGKELFARWIHQESGSSGPFVPINCASVPDTLWESELFGHMRGAFTDARERRKGLVEVAADGILFFDEIGDMPLEMQGKLLRLIQERQYRPLGASEEKSARCRFLFATHRYLNLMVQTGEFRKDLYYRISTLTERIPPLRERQEDILPLLDHYLALNSSKYRIAPVQLESELRNAALNYAWPGNVRQLESLALRLSLEYPSQKPDLNQFLHALDPSRADQHATQSVANANTVYHEQALSDLGLASGITLDFDHLVQNYSRHILKEALERSDGNRTRAASLLGISRGRFNYQWKQLFDE